MVLMIVIDQDVNTQESEPYFSLCHQNQDVLHRCRNANSNSDKELEKGHERKRVNLLHKDMELKKGHEIKREAVSPYVNFT